MTEVYDKLKKQYDEMEAKAHEKDARTITLKKAIQEQDKEIAALKKQIKDNNILNLTDEENQRRSLRHVRNMGSKVLYPEAHLLLEAALDELSEELFPEIKAEKEN